VCGALVGILLAASGLAGAAERTAASPPAVPRPAASPAMAVAESAAGPEAPLPEYRPAVVGSDGVLVWDGLRGLLALGGVLLAVGLGARALRRWPGLLPRQVRPEGLQLVGRLPLSTKESVCLVRVGSEVLVVGVAAGGLTLLHRLAAAAETPGTSGGGGARGEDGRLPVAGFRDVVTRLREAQAAWGLGAADGEGKA
jgi:hypothetical protein